MLAHPTVLAMCGTLHPGKELKAPQGSRPCSSELNSSGSYDHSAVVAMMAQELGEAGFAWLYLSLDQFYSWESFLAKVFRQKVFPQLREITRHRPGSICSCPDQRHGTLCLFNAWQPYSPPNTLRLARVSVDKQEPGNAASSGPVPEPQSPAAMSAAGAEPATEGGPCFFPCLRFRAQSQLPGWRLRRRAGCIGRQQPWRGRRTSPRWRSTRSCTVALWRSRTVSAQEPGLTALHASAAVPRNGPAPLGPAPGPGIHASRVPPAPSAARPGLGASGTWDWQRRSSARIKAAQAGAGPDYGPGLASCLARPGLCRAGPSGLRLSALLLLLGELAFSGG